MGWKKPRLPIAKTLLSNKVTKRKSKKTADLINAYHTIEKQIAAEKDSKVIGDLKAQQAALGGLDLYQNASLQGASSQRGGDASKWLLQTLKAPHLYKQETLCMLDVGAIDGSAYQSEQDWLKTTYIDLNPRAAHVMACDFFDFATASPFDIVCLSLVMNFVGAPEKRGQMLLHAHALLKAEGYLYIVLPLPCMDNSRYMNAAHFYRLVETNGYKVVKQYDSTRLSYWLLQRQAGFDATQFTPYAKVLLQDGVKKNNFCIVLKR